MPENPNPQPDDTQETKALALEPAQKPKQSEKSLDKKRAKRAYNLVNKRRGGYNNRLTEDTAKTVYLALANGARLKHAAAAVRVSAATLQKWLRYGDLLNQAFPDGPPADGFTDDDVAHMREFDPDLTATTDVWPLLMEFFPTCEAIRAQKVIDHVSRIDKAAEKGNWFADAWLLEREYPDEFALGRNREVGGPRVIQNNTVTVNQINVNENERAAEILQILHEFGDLGGIASRIDRIDDAETDEVYSAGALPPPEASGFPPSEL